MRVTAHAAVVPVIGRVDGVDQLFVNPCTQLVIRAITAQHLDFNAVPFIGGDFRPTEPLAHGRRNIVTGHFVSAEVSLDLAEPNFIIGVGCSLDTHDMLVIVTRFVAEFFAHVNHGTQIDGVCFRGEEAYDLRWRGASLEVNRFGAAESASVIDQSIH